jgi:Holliday junction resolvase RusA-like endonuclease
VRTVLSLPIPPTANNLFPTGRSGRRYRSKEYTAWLDAAGWELKGQPRNEHPGKVTFLYEVGRFPDKHRRDLLNREKAVTDLLVSHGIIDDDALIERGTLQWSDAVPAGRVRVTVEDV